MTDLFPKTEAEGLLVGIIIGIVWVPTGLYIGSLYAKIRKRITERSGK